MLDSMMLPVSGSLLEGHMPCRVQILSLGQFPVVYHLPLLLTGLSNSLYETREKDISITSKV